MEAPALIAARDLDGDFQLCVEQHMLHGWVYAGPDFFGMVRCVRSEWDDDYLEDPSNWVLPEDANAWYLMGVVGHAAEAFSRLPFPLPQIIWKRERTQKTHRLPYERFKKLLLRQPVAECGFHAFCAPNPKRHGGWRPAQATKTDSPGKDPGK